MEGSLPTTIGAIIFAIVSSGVALYLGLRKDKNEVHRTAVTEWENLYDAMKLEIATIRKEQHDERRMCAELRKRVRHLEQLLAQKGVLFKTWDSTPNHPTNPTE